MTSYPQEIDHVKSYTSQLAKEIPDIMKGFYALSKAGSASGSLAKLLNMGTPLNTSYDDFSLVVDSEMKNGYFSSNRTGGKGDDDIYSYEIIKPFIFEKKSASSSSDGFLRLFYPLFLIVATAGIAQFFLQFFYKPDWLFDYRPFLPDLVRNKNPMNTVIPFAGFIKSNGFFSLNRRALVK